MTRAELERLLADVQKARIGIIGDFCLDAYWYLDPALSELSIETGLPTRAVRSQRYSLGGAGNVAANLMSMGVGIVRAFGVLGDDPFGREMIRILDALKVNRAGMRLQAQTWSTPVYAKPVEGDSELNRIDFGNANALAVSTEAALLDDLRRALPDLDLVIINQQLLHGIHTESLRTALVALLAEAAMRSPPIPFLTDSRSFSDSYQGAIRKLNDREALRLCGKKWDSEDPVPRQEAQAVAEELFSRWNCTLFLTRGPRGTMVCERGKVHEVAGLQILGRVDPVGAGDSALAGIAAALAAGASSLAAAELGSFVAGVTVQKLFTTGTASPQEILAIGAHPDYIYEPELAADARQAHYREETDIEIINAPRPGERIALAIFDNDGTISTLREGWERIMEPVMVRAILGKGAKTVEERLSRAVSERVREYIDQTTGMQTLAQMEGLAEMVREFGLVPQTERPDAKGYKAIYNEEILALVRRRLARIARGELAVEDFLVKGSVEFLEALAASGVKLYLASGTDQEDVVAEAGALGYARLFGGRIFGSVGDVKHEAKKVVLERILDDLRPSAATAGHGGRLRRSPTSPTGAGLPDGPPGLFTFGDGPVEMRETRKRGGTCVGVASDEVRRFGLNRRKRERLIRAGADLVLPDFSQWRELLPLLGMKG